MPSSVETGKALNNRKETGSYFGKIKAVLIILSIFAAVKMLFFAFGLDEEYQLVMAYRNVKGDKLLFTMWEPHQTSAFLCSLLMRPYLALFGTTGVAVWLRLCGTLIHLGVSCYLCRTLRRMVSGESAFLLGLIYFNTIPKQIMLPEFGIMQVWFLTLMSLFLLRYYDCGGSEDGKGVSGGNRGDICVIKGVGGACGSDSGVRNRKYLILAAFTLVLEVLSYPSCLLLDFPVMWIIWRRSGKNRFSDMGIVTGICGLCAVVYLALLLRNNTPEGLLRTVSYIVNGDITHSLTVADKLIALGKDMLLPVILCMGIFFAAKAAASLTGKRLKRKGGAAEGETGRTKEKADQEKTALQGIELIWTAVFSLLVELWYWIVCNAGYESMQIHLVVFAVLGIIYYRKRCTDTAGDNGVKKAYPEALMCQRRLQSGLLLDGICMAGAALVAVLYLTDLGLMDSLPHAMTAAFFGMVLVVMNREEERFLGGAKKKAKETAEESGKNVPEGIRLKNRGSEACVLVVLVLWALTAVFGKGYTLRSGTGYHNVLQSGGILKYGPAAGTISDYMCAYIYNCDYEDWQDMIRDGDKVLIMVDQIMNLGTIQYLFRDVEISHYSIVNPTAYDERLKEYWEMFPEKQPNVIIVDDWYGQLMTDPEGWLMRYAEGEFGYTSVEQGRYIRIYRRGLDDNSGIID